MGAFMMEWTDPSVWRWEPLYLKTLRSCVSLWALRVATFSSSLTSFSVLCLCYPQTLNGVLLKSCSLASGVRVLWGIKEQPFRVWSERPWYCRALSQRPERIWVVTVNRELGLLLKRAGAEVAAMWRAVKSARQTELEGLAPDHTWGSALGNCEK